MQSCKLDKSPRSILIVEDDIVAQKIFEHIAHTVKSDIRVRCVRSGEEAEEILRNSSKFDLVVADNRLLGEETGVELWQKFKKEKSSTPFILTSSTKAAQLIEAMGEEASLQPEFIQKPIMYDECRQLFQEALEQPVSQHLIFLEAEMDVEDDLIDIVDFQKHALLSMMLVGLTMMLSFLLSPSSNPVSVAPAIEKAAPAPKLQKRIKDSKHANTHKTVSFKNLGLVSG